MTVLPRVGVLASGGGTNLQALIDAQRAGALGVGQLVVVGANRADCGALARARAAAIDTFCVEHRNFSAREAFDAAVVAALQAARVDWVVLAGFMRILTPAFVAHYSESDKKLLTFDPNTLEPALRGTVQPNAGDILAQRDPLLAGVVLTDDLVDRLMDYMSALTDNAARDLSGLVPARVPSKLSVAPGRGP